MDNPEWTVLVAGCGLCLMFSIFLNIIKHRHDLYFGIIGPVVGVIGVLMLTSMALVGPEQESNKENVVAESALSFEDTKAAAQTLRIKTLVVKAFRDSGKKPGEDYRAHMSSDGTVVWLSKEDYSTRNGGN